MRILTILFNATLCIGTFMQAVGAVRRAGTSLATSQTSLRRLCTTRDITKPPVFQSTATDPHDQKMQYLRWLEFNHLNPAARTVVARAIIETRHAQRSPHGKNLMAEIIKHRNQTMAAQLNKFDVRSHADKTVGIQKALNLIGVSTKNLPRIIIRPEFKQGHAGANGYLILMSPEDVALINLFFEKYFNDEKLNAQSMDAVGVALFTLFHEYAHILREHRIRIVSTEEMLKTIPFSTNPLAYHVTLRMQRSQERFADNYAIRMIAEHFVPETAIALLKGILRDWQNVMQLEAHHFSAETATVQNDPRIAHLKDVYHDISGATIDKTGDYHPQYAERLKSVQNMIDELEKRIPPKKLGLLSRVTGKCFGNT